MPAPFENSRAAVFITERLRDLKHRKTQEEVAREVGMPTWCSARATHQGQPRAAAPRRQMLP